MDTVGVLPVKIQATIYKGGTITLNTAEYEFINTGFTEKLIITSYANYIYNGVDELAPGDRLAVLKYNIPTKTGIFDSNDTTTPELQL
jgi:hypothetical protein